MMQSSNDEHKRRSADDLSPLVNTGDIELITNSQPSSESTTLLHKARASLRSMGPPIEHVRGFVDDFQDFIQQGNMIDLAVGLILGKSFTAILDSFVGDILSPILSLFSDKSLANYYAVARCPPLVIHCNSDTWATWQAARAAGAVTVNYGQFLENFVNFLINALFLYIAIKKVLEVLFQRKIVMKRQCPACKEFRLSCRGCRILRAELVRCQRESEAQATQDAQRCLAMYDHMERLARLNMALTQSRRQSHQMNSQPMEKRVVVDTLCHDKEPKRVQQLQETIGQQAREIERLQRTLKSSVPMLPWDGTIRAMSNEKDDSSEDDHGENSEPDDSADCIRRPRRGLEKLPLTSLHAQLRARDATIHRLEQHVAELTSAVDACREKKSRAIAQYQKLTKAQQTQLKKYTARIYEQQRTQRKGEREIEGLQAYVAVLEKKLLARRPEIRHGSS